MRFEMKMPDLATTDSEIRIARWLIKTGQKVERGQPLVEVETDKAAMEVESVVSGVLAEVHAAANQSVSVGQIIAVLEVEGMAPGVVSPTTIAHDAGPTADSVPLLRGSSAGPVALPSTASEQAAARPSGMFARNRAAAGVASPPAAGIALTVAERTAGRRLQESKQTIPHFYLQTSVNAAAMIARREEAKPVAKLAWDAFFVLAVAKAVAKFDRFRCRLDGERLTPIDSDAIGVAVDVEGELYVIPIASPAAKTVERISGEIRQGVERLRQGDPDAKQIRLAILTITNLGACNVEGFIPIISPPEPAILGIGRVAPTPVVQADGRIGVEHRCTLTLSVDHRIVSGKYAGEFLGAIVKELDSFGEPKP